MLRLMIYFLVPISFLLYNCDDFFCDPEDVTEDNDSSKTENALRFKSLDIPIEGKLYFVAGPNSTTENDSFYNNMPWYFWKLEGTEFSKLNEIAWPYLWSGHWEFQFSPKANYFSFFDDKGGEISNTDDIGLLNLSNFNEYYFTDSLGDANPSDQWVYQWDFNEEYIYFNSIQFGISEYDTLANSDLYKVSPNNYLEQLTDTPYFEVGVQPSPNGKYLVYIIENRNATPEDKVGIYLMDLDTKQSEMIVNQNEYDSQSTGWSQIGNEVFWHLNSESFILNVWKEGNNRFFIYKLSDNSLTEFTINDFHYFHKLMFIPGQDKIMLFGGSEYYNAQIGYIWEHQVIIYDILTSDITVLTDDIEIPINVTSGLGMPTLSPDGRYIAFVASDPSKLDQENDYYWSHLHQYAEIYIMDLSDYSIRQITNGLLGYEGHLKWVE